MERSLTRLPVLFALAMAPAACVPALPAAMAGDAPSPGGGGSAVRYESGPASGSMVAEVERLINADRARVGCPPLQWDGAAASAAQAHSDDMARRNYFSHTSPEGRTVVDRMRAQGADYRSLGENIAMGQRNAAEVVRGWLTSPGHRANIENCRYTRAGVGFREYRWTQVFYTPPR